MARNSTIDYLSMIAGNMGNPGSWDIISDTSHDLGGKIVGALLSMDANGGTFTAMQEETTPARGGNAGISAAVAAKYLTYTYPFNVFFAGRYTLLTPNTSCKFLVYFLK